MFLFDLKKYANMNHSYNLSLTLRYFYTGCKKFEHDSLEGNCVLPHVSF